MRKGVEKGGDGRAFFLMSLVAMAFRTAMADEWTE
jgi:hypothetical protein